MTVPLTAICHVRVFSETASEQMICLLSVSEKTEVDSGSEMTDHLSAKCSDSVSEGTEARGEVRQRPFTELMRQIICSLSVLILSLKRQKPLQCNIWL